MYQYLPLLSIEIVWHFSISPTCYFRYYNVDRLNDNKNLREETYVVVNHYQCLIKNQLNLQDIDHVLLVNYHPKVIILIEIKFILLFKFTFIL